MKYYIAYKGRRIGEALTKEEAIIELFQLNKTFSNISILVYDDKDKLKGEIPKKRPYKNT